MISLHMRMTILLAVFFAIVYAIVTLAATAMGETNFYFHLALAGAIVFFQYLIGPKIVEWSMRIRYIQRQDDPKLWDMVEMQARQAGIPMPRVCISQMNIPNAFAFGRGFSDGRVCVTEGIRRLLSDEELKAVIGHELGHLRNRDVVTMTLLSVVPLVLYRVAWHFLWYGRRNNRSSGPSSAAIALVAFLFYFITNLLVLYASRIREYFADKASVEFGNRPEALASALYKLVYGSARMNKDDLREAEGMKAFFLNDPSAAAQEFRELSQLDFNKSGTIDAGELAAIRSAGLNLSGTDRMMEILQTHPNMLKRIQHLSQLG